MSDPKKSRASDDLNEAVKRIDSDYVLLWAGENGMDLATSFDDLESLKRFHATFTALVAKRIAAETSPEEAGGYLGQVCMAAMESLRTRLGGKKS